MKTYKGITIEECGDSTLYDGEITLKPGTYYLLLRSPQQGDDSYHLRREPGRTNSSHETRLHGWLGTTNNVAWYAEGCVRVNEDGRIKKCADDAPEEELSAD